MNKYVFLEQLINTSSPSGFEEKASELWRFYLQKSLTNKVYKIETDNYGNSVVSIRPPRPYIGSKSILLCGHIDEVGMMVNYINDEGFIYISMIGYVEASILPAQRVIIHNTNGKIKGIIGRRPPHLADEENEEEVKVHNVFIDIGARDKEDALKYVSIGDPITFDVSYTELLNNTISARGLDDRIGAWIVARVLEELANNDKFNVPIFGAATIQEENGCYGGIMVAKRVNPSVALAIDLTHSTDVPDISKERHGECNLGNGPVLSIGSVSHKKVNGLLEKVAVQNRIDIQKIASPIWSGTDADVLFTENGGIPTGLISIPSRYMHSPCETISLADAENAVELIVKWCEEINENTKW